MITCHEGVVGLPSQGQVRRPAVRKSLDYHGATSVVGLEPVRMEDKVILGRLLELYLYEFSEFAGADINDHGLYGYRYLDHYWTEPDRHRFFIREDSRLAGFAMVGRLDGGAWSMAEFFVLRKYRRRGIGRAAAHQVITRFSGSWEVRYTTSNGFAVAFWPGVIEELASDSSAGRDEPGWIIRKFETTGSTPSRAGFHEDGPRP